MNLLLRLAFTLGLSLGLLSAGQVVGRADAPSPIDVSQIIKVMPVGAGWNEVVAEVSVECSGTGHPLYHSTKLESQSFEGDFTPATDCQVAIFSDDGSDVTVDGNKVWSGKGKGQTLEKLNQSLHKLNLTLTANTTHHIQVDYQNSWYTGNGDIDGVTLFAYDRPLDITFPNGLTNGTVRACAGAIPDSVHEQTVTIHAADAVSPAAGQSLTVAFDTSVDYTGCKAPQLVDDQNNGALVSTLTRTTDSNGNISVTVLSSDLISQPNLTVAVGGNQIGQVGCDFEGDQSLRRFPDPNDPDDLNWQSDDTGWICDTDQFTNPGSSTPAKIYVKFMKDPGQGDVDGNWDYVNNHNVLMIIGSVTLADGTIVSDPTTITQYLYMTDPISGAQSSSVVATTSNDGSAQVSVTAGPNIDYVSDIQFNVTDLTQILR